MKPFENEENGFIDKDADLTVEQLEARVYKGYPEWIRDSFTTQKQLLKKYTDLSKMYVATTLPQKIEFLIQQMISNSSQ